MANYYATSRSNYFKVKDIDSFRKWADSLNLEVWDNGDGRFGITPMDEDSGEFPSWRIDQESGEDVDIDFAAELAEHLVDGEVAILMSAGAEKKRYISGYAEAVNSKGETVSLRLTDIYEMAKKLGTGITSAEY